MLTPDQISKLPPELRTHALMCIKGGIFEACLTWGLQVRHEFKNFHRSLCARFGYCHDEKDWDRDQVSLEEYIAATIATLTRERNSLITGLEPNGYPLWFNRAVHECKQCDPEDMCDRHHTMAVRNWIGCEKEIEAFRAKLERSKAVDNAE